MNQTKKISRAYRKQLLKRLKAQTLGQRKALYLAGLLAWIQFLMRVISFGYIAKIFEDLYYQKTANIVMFIIVVIALNVFGFLVALVAKKYQGVVSSSARNKLKQQFFEVFEVNASNLDQLSTADILTVASQGIDMLDTYYSVYLAQTLRTYLNCSTILVIVGIMYPSAALLFVVSLPFIPVFIILIQKRSKKIMNHYWNTYMDVGNQFMDNLDGMNTLFAYQQDAMYERNFVEKAEIFRKSTMELLKFQLQSVGYMDGIMYLGIALSGCLIVGAFQNQVIGLFSLVFFLLIAAEFFAPIREAGYGMHLVMMNTKMADRIFTFLDSVEISKNDQLLNIDNVTQLEFHDVTFSYGHKNLFEYLNFKVLPNEIFAIAGESGKGKTTLAKLLLGQITATQGHITYNGLDIIKLHKQALVQKIAHVSNDSYLFNGTIMDNLLLGTTKTETEVRKWITEHNVLNFVEELPDKYQTIVGENGQLLSGGQRQQIICVRALLSNKSMYIFDEVTSSVDIEHEQVIFDLIKLAKKEAVVIFISHKMKQVLACDRVLFLAEEQHLGTPESLLQVDTFQQLVTTQQRLEDIFNEK